MKKILRSIYLSIAIFVMEKIVFPILDIIDALYARRKYRKLFQDVGKMYDQYVYTKNLYLINGGYEANKEIIASRAKILKNNAEIVGEALSTLNTEWYEFFGETSREIISKELEVLEEIREFGASCQSEST